MKNTTFVFGSGEVAMLASTIQEGKTARLVLRDHPRGHAGAPTRSVEGEPISPRQGDVELWFETQESLVDLMGILIRLRIQTWHKEIGEALAAEREMEEGPTWAETSAGGSTTRPEVPEAPHGERPAPRGGSRKPSRPRRRPRKRRS